MPKFDTITISVDDLKRLIVAIENQKFTGIVTITDTEKTYSVRDQDDFKLAEIGKTTTEIF